MRMKFLSVIASIFFFCFAVVSCLGSSDPIEYTPDATIKAFEIDSIYGVCYKFTIDQIKGEIYNQDSVPVSADTIINKILITKLTTASNWVVTGGDPDTLLNTNDSINFLNTMNEPLLFKVIAPDGVTTKEYKIKVLRHKQDPDSLVWRNMDANFEGPAFNDSRTVIINNELHAYTSNTTFYSSPVDDGKTWTVNNSVNLPANIKLHSLLKYNNLLYILTDTEQMFVSEDGMEWSESPLSGNVVALLSTFPEGGAINAVPEGGIAAIINDNGTRRFAISNKDVTAWDLGEELEASDYSDFPVGENGNYYVNSTTYPTRTGVVRSLLIGKPVDSGATQSSIWFTLDGKAWTELATSSSFFVPAMNKPTIMYYADKLYAYGDGFETFYASEDGGLIWKEVEEKFMFAGKDGVDELSFAGRTNYSSVVDDDNYIWIIWNHQNSGNVQHGNEVYKGRLNKLGFKPQE